MKNPVFFLFFSFCLCAGSWAKGYGPGHFSHTMVIQGPLKANSLYEIHLRPEILERLNKNENDLRIFDLSTNEIPYVIIRNDIPAQRPEAFPFEIIRYDEESSAQTLVIRNQTGSRMINTLELETGTADFQKTVRLFGGYHTGKWTFLKEDTFYDFSSHISLKKTSLAFQESDYPFYKLILTDRRTDGQEEENLRLRYKDLDFSTRSRRNKMISISGVTGIRNNPKDPVVLYDQKSVTRFVPSQDKEGDTIITLDEGINFSRIYFQVADMYYFRDAALYGKQDDDDEYGYLTAGPIYCFSLSGLNDTRNFLDCEVPGIKQYQVRIRNRGNPAL
ncbi:MAG: hypothetical protein PHF84_06955, partial [bacterium]|nr:hypothetical protein [bacterium]